VCTNIATRTRIAGSAKTASGWLPVDEVTVAFDHATHAWLDHALRIDLTSGTAVADRAAVELDLASGKALVALLQEVIAEAERRGFAE